MKVQFAATIEMDMPDGLVPFQQKDFAENCIYYAQPYDGDEQQLCVFSMSDFKTSKIE